MLVISSPSGAGKSTIAAHLLEDGPSSSASPSASRHGPAPAERDCRQALSLHHRAANSSGCAIPTSLLEWAEVHGNFYGTPREPVEAGDGRRPRHAVRYRLAGRPAACRTRCQADVVSIFVLPPTMTGAPVAPASPRRGHRRGHPQRVSQFRARDRTLARTTTMSSSTMI